MFDEIRYELNDVKVNRNRNVRIIDTKYYIFMYNKFLITLNLR